MPRTELYSSYMSLNDILASPALNLEINKATRDELLHYLFENDDLNYAQKYLFYQLFFQLNYDTQATFLAAIENSEKQLFETLVRFEVYSAWQKKDLVEKDIAIKAIPIQHLSAFKQFLRYLDIPKDEMHILADTLIKSPDKLDQLLATPKMYPLSTDSAVEKYKEIFESIESEVLQQSALHDNFMDKLDDIIADYKIKYQQQAKNSENQTLYEEMIRICKTERNQYAIGPRNDASQTRCKKDIADRIKHLEATLQINESNLASMLRGIKTTFGVKQTANKVQLSQHMNAFMRHPNTQMVKDLLEICDDKHFLKK
jgi:hypothetical protein